MGVAKWRGCGRGGTSLGQVRSPSPKGRKPKATVVALDHPILFLMTRTALHCAATSSRLFFGTPD